MTKTSVAVFDHVQGGSVQRNKITEYTEVGCYYPNKPPLVKTTNSTGITIANNGVDAIPVVPTHTAPVPTQGASTPVPTQAQSTPAPTKAQSTPVPTAPPSSSSCPAPANLTGSPGPQGSGRFDFRWTPSANATEYSFYYAQAPAQPTVIYAGPFTSSPASAFSLNANTSYNFAVRAKCGTVESLNSNVVAVNQTTQASPTPTRIPTPIPTGIPSATSTPIPGSTGISLNLLLHGIGKGGE